MAKRGWSEEENAVLDRSVNESRKKGGSLSGAFAETALLTGRMANSVRNHYYERARAAGGSVNRSVPFTEKEERELVISMGSLIKNGFSVRKAALGLAGGDASLMLRYQNKFRSLLEKKPALVRELAGELNCLSGSARGRKREAALLSVIDEKDRELALARERLRLLSSVFEKLSGLREIPAEDFPGSA